MDDVFVETFRFRSTRSHLVTCRMSRVDEHHKQQIVFDSQMTVDLTLSLNLNLRKLTLTEKLMREV